MSDKPDYEVNNQTEMMKQKLIENILTDGFRTQRHTLGSFLPKEVEKIRIVPGDEADELAALTCLIYGAEDDNKQFIEQWIRDHGWTRKWIRDAEGKLTSNPGSVTDDLMPFTYRDESGKLYYYWDEQKKPAHLPEYLFDDLRYITHHITTTIGLMSAELNEQLIVSNLEGRDLDRFKPIAGQQTKGEAEFTR